MTDVENQEQSPLSRPYNPDQTCKVYSDDTKGNFLVRGIHKNPFVNYMLLICIAVIIGMSAGCVVALFLKTGNTHDKPSTEAEAQPQTAGLLKIHSKHHKTQKLDVVSYLDYQTKMLEISDNTLIDLYVSIESENDWPQTVPLYNSEKVTMLYLEGLYDLKTLYFFLQNLPNLAHLHINNTNDDNCEERYDFQADKFPSNFSKVKMEGLKELSLENFSECSNFLKSFPHLAETKALHNLRIDNGQIDSENVQGVRSIIHASRKTLKKLCFPMTTWDVVLFEEDFMKMPNLLKLRLDFLSSRKLVQYIIADVKTTFPKLDSFISLHGHARFQDFQNILGSTTIKKLETGITVPEHYDEFKAFFQKNDFPSLNLVELNIHFEKISRTMICPMEAVEELKKSFKVIEIHYECEVQTKSPYLARMMSSRFSFG